MESALNAFLITLAIVGGILSPLILIAVLTTINRAFLSLGQHLLNTAERIKKLPPYDDVWLNLDPATKVLTARLYRNGKIIYQGSVSQNDLREANQDDPINFRKDAE